MISEKIARFILGNAPASARTAERETEDYENLYFDLLMEVATVYPGETRHDTAKRYIREREQAREGPTKASAP